MSEVKFEDFQNFDIRVGEIIKVKDFPEANKPSFKLWIDFGGELGIKKSSAQITDLYKKAYLKGRQIIAVTNFPPLKIANFSSEVLVLGVYSKEGVVLLQPDKRVNKGTKIG